MREKTLNITILDLIKKNFISLNIRLIVSRLRSNSCI